LHFQTGEWDALFVWEMEGNMADLEWYRSEDDIKWFAAPAEQRVLGKYGCKIPSIGLT
jgi:hypothetical protein